MNAALIVVVLAAAGVNFGWQPAEDEPDGYEYVVQIEPELLDVLKRGEKVPIQSNVPPEITPIRKVSFVVGRGDLPRQPLSGVERTAYFAGQPAWTPDRYDGVAPAAATRTDDRYGPPPAFNNRSAVAPPPSGLDRAQAAVTETGNTLRDGVEAGIQAANEQLYRGGEEVRDSAFQAGQQFGQRLQEFATDPQRELQSTGNNLRNAAEQTLGGVRNQLQQVTNPFATAGTQPTVAANRTQSSVAPPPWPLAAPPTAASSNQPATIGQTAPSQSAPPSSFAREQTPAGWTSINPNVAGPPMVMPQLATAPRAGNTAAARHTDNDNGPAFPDSPSSPSITRQPIHSVLNDPSAPGAAQTAADDWSAGWNNAPAATQATIGRAANGDGTTQSGTDQRSGLVAVQPIDKPRQQSPAPQQAQQASDPWGDTWAQGDLWSQSPQPSPANTAVQNPAPANTVSRAGDTTAPTNSQQVGPSANSARDVSSTPAQEPWLPLLVVSLSLMGSLSANLFLGWSYMDARQKYRSLVEKTANALRRTKPAAA